MGRGERVSFMSEVEAEVNGLCLCPSDMNRTNFMKDQGGRIVALDFCVGCCLPPSFFAFALREGENFTQLIAKKVKHFASTRLNAMLTASYGLVPYGTNKIGEYITLRSFLYLAPRDYCKLTEFNVLHRSSARAQVQVHVDMVHKPSPF